MRSLLDENLDGIVGHIRGVQVVALTIKKAHVHIVLPNRSHDKTQAAPAERTRRRAFHGTMFGTCAGDNEMQMTQFQVFEIMIVTCKVGLHVVLFQDRQEVLDYFRLVAVG